MSLSGIVIGDEKREGRNVKNGKLTERKGHVPQHVMLKSKGCN